MIWTHKIGALVAVVVLFVLGGAAMYMDWNRFGEGGAVRSAAVAQAGGEVPIGGTFTLTNDKGQRVSEQMMQGKYHLLFFGFANCADACPAMLSTMDWVYRQLPFAKQANMQVVFISVDPMRDTAGKLGEYVRGFNPAFEGWVGTQQEIDVMTKNYLAYYAVPDGARADDAEYQVKHSTYLYLMGPDGKYITHFRQSDSAVAIRDGLEKLVADAPAG